MEVNFKGNGQKAKGNAQKAEGGSWRAIDRVWKLEFGKINRYAIAFILFHSSFFYNKATAQCAMCRASLESSGQEKQAEALNDGIVYLMVIPYVLVAVAGFFIYRMYTKKKN